MSSSFTYSGSYTVVDVRKVMDMVHADARMVAQATGLRTQAYVDRVMGDVQTFAESGYLEKIEIRLVAGGKNVKVWSYDVNEKVSGLSSDRPGGNLSSVNANRMSFTLYYSDKWKAMADTDQEKFRNKLAINWTTTTDDLSVAHLSVSDERAYVSNSYGVTRKVYK